MIQYSISVDGATADQVRDRLEASYDEDLAADQPLSAPSSARGANGR